MRDVLTWFDRHVITISEVILLGLLMFLMAYSIGDWISRQTCHHDWRYDEEESAKPYTGYAEKCRKCGAISQVPQ